MRWWLASIGGFLMVLLGMMQQSAATAQTATLQQRIVPVECQITTISTGSGTIDDINCPYLPPLIQSVTVNHKAVVLSGMFDAHFTSSLRAFAAGRWYVYGVDPELTIAGNTWQLDLSAMSDTWPDGDYTITIETTSYDGSVHTTTTQVRLVADPTPEPSTPDEGGSSTSPTAPLTGFAPAKKSITWLLGSVTLVGIWLVVYWRRRSR